MVDFAKIQVKALMREFLREATENGHFRLPGPSLRWVSISSFRQEHKVARKDRAEHQALVLRCSHAQKKKLSVEKRTFQGEANVSSVMPCLEVDIGLRLIAYHEEGSLDGRRICRDCHIVSRKSGRYVDHVFQWNCRECPSPPEGTRRCFWGGTLAENASHLVQGNGHSAIHKALHMSMTWKTFCLVKGQICSGTVSSQTMPMDGNTPSETTSEARMGDLVLEVVN